MLRSIAAFSALLTSAPALACGGFFCQTVPVDQAAERILFAVDEAAGEVEVQVQITYAGAAEEFAWVLPVPQEPTLQVTTDDVFNTLNNATRPQWNLRFETQGRCKSQFGFGSELAIRPEVNVMDADTAEASPRNDGVKVVKSGPIGPYETVVLQATDAGELVTWLQTNQYIVPDTIEATLAPYVAEQSYFVALRLQKDREAGDLMPIALRYAGTDPQIPLQLTAVAASPDMRLQPYVLGSARAVPDNYLHVTPNLLAVDWLRQGQNFGDVVSAAANEAGGQAFATEFAGKARLLDGAFWSLGQTDTTRFASATALMDVLNGMQNAGFPISTGTVPILRRFIEVPQNILDANGITDVNFFQCVDCWTDPSDVEVNTATLGADLGAALISDWVAPMRHAQELADHAEWLTRMLSSMDADEMTSDPTFVLNADQRRVSNVHYATLVTLCGNNAYWEFEAPRRLDLPDGRSLILPPDYMNDPTFDVDAYVLASGAPASQTIEDAGRTGPMLLVRDNGPEIDAAIAALNDAYPLATCGCSSTGGASVAWLGLVGLALGRRRRA